jgi:uncharacterized coiled-coil DUF342 family protein
MDLYEILDDLRELHQALSSPMAVDPQDRRELEEEIRQLQHDLEQLRQDAPPERTEPEPTG